MPVDLASSEMRFEFNARNDNWRDPPDSSGNVSNVVALLMVEYSPCRAAFVGALWMVGRASRLGRGGYGYRGLSVSSMRTSQPRYDRDAAMHPMDVESMPHFLRSLRLSRCIFSSVGRQNTAVSCTLYAVRCTSCENTTWKVIFNHPNMMSFPCQSQCGEDLYLVSLQRFSIFSV